jgi:mono/diheme cytochrome c family protein
VRLRNASGKLLTVIVGALVRAASLRGRPGLAQAPSDKQVVEDTYQRSADHYAFTATAKSGPQRGEELYYYKCWFCHNQFAKRAPYRDILKRPNVTDQTVAETIRKGGPGMPAYGTTLDEAAVADLVSYLKEKCCWEGEDAPPNPRYIAGTKR